MAESLADDPEGHEKQLAMRRRSLEKSLSETRSSLTNLRQLRIRGLITDEEFVQDRAELQREELNFEQKLRELDDSSDQRESICLLDRFIEGAAQMFVDGNDETKRTIFMLAASAPKLLDKTLLTEPRWPFMYIESDAFEMQPLDEIQLRERLYMVRKIQPDSFNGKR